MSSLRSVFASFFAETAKQHECQKSKHATNKKEGPVAAATESPVRKCSEKQSRAKSRETKEKRSRCPARAKA